MTSHILVTTHLRLSHHCEVVTPLKQWFLTGYDGQDKKFYIKLNLIFLYIDTRKTRIFARIGILALVRHPVTKEDLKMVSNRTMEDYMKAGAEMRLYKNLGTKLAVDISKVLSAADQDKMLRAMNKIDEICSKAEDNMFHDHPELSNDYLNVFYGNVGENPRNDVDAKVLSMSREAADELFKREGY